jgi:8-oxo-dGTP pyrophosphatase MutT (NUDIX family)
MHCRPLTRRAAATSMSSLARLPEKFMSSHHQKATEFTNVFLLNSRDGSMLLGMKRRGFGAGKLNGFGGKLEGDETPLQCAHRELEEEACVRATELIKVGECHYRYEGDDDKVRELIVWTTCHMHVAIYLCSLSWSSVPGESKHTKEQECRCISKRTHRQANKQTKQTNKRLQSKQSSNILNTTPTHNPMSPTNYFIAANKAVSCVCVLQVGRRTSRNRRNDAEMVQLGKSPTR